MGLFHVVRRPENDILILIIMKNDIEKSVFNVVCVLYQKDLKPFEHNLIPQLKEEY